MIKTGYSTVNESESLNINESVDNSASIIDELSRGLAGKLSKGSKNLRFTCNTEKGYDTFNELVKKAKSIGLKEYGTNNGNVTPSGMHYNFKDDNGIKVKITNVPSDDFKSYTPTIVVSKSINESLDMNESSGTLVDAKLAQNHIISARDMLERSAKKHKVENNSDYKEAIADINKTIYSVGKLIGADLNESTDMSESFSSAYSIQDLIDDGTWVPGEDDDEIDTCKLYMKELKCSSLEELLSVTEDDDNDNYDKLVKLTKGIKGKRVKGAPQDIASEIIALSDGTKVIAESAYGYYSYYFSKKDANKLEKLYKSNK